jgi:hypothetical protein
MGIGVGTGVAEKTGGSVGSTGYEGSRVGIGSIGPDGAGTGVAAAFATLRLGSAALPLSVADGEGDGVALSVADGANARGFSMWAVVNTGTKGLNITIPISTQRIAAMTIRILFTRSNDQSLHRPVHDNRGCNAIRKVPPFVEGLVSE